MQGSGVSSLAIWTAFDTMTTANVRPLSHSVRISWKRVEDGSLSFATVGTSVVGGSDIVKGQQGVITPPDVFSYTDESDNVVSVEYERELLEPLGGIALAQADVSLENTDLRFTPNQNGTIGTAILPNRPLNISLGFHLRSMDKTLFVFKGLTDMPREDKLRRISMVHCYDYIKYMDKYALESTMYTDQRSDQIINDILTTVGFGSSQFELDEGLNTIGFAWFKKGQTAGERIKRICEAEEAFFYQDENGILRFENRRHYSASPHSDIQWTIETDDILDWFEDNTTQVINRCIVDASPREGASSRELWSLGIVEELKVGETKEIWASFEDPATSLTSPVSTTDYLANTASDGSGTNVTDDISVSITSFTETAKLEIKNNYTTSVYITYFRIRGTPALVTSQVREEYYDQDSIDKYEEQQFLIENDFIDDADFAYYLARSIVRKYRTPLRRIRIMVRGIPQLQLRDKVRVYDRDLSSYSNYRVMKITGRMVNSSFVQTLTLREITDFEADNWAVVGVDTVEGPGVVGS